MAIPVPGHKDQESEEDARSDYLARAEVEARQASANVILGEAEDQARIAVLKRLQETQALLDKHAMLELVSTRDRGVGVEEPKELLANLQKGVSHTIDNKALLTLFSAKNPKEESLWPQGWNEPQRIERSKAFMEQMLGGSNLAAEKQSVAAELSSTGQKLEAAERKLTLARRELRFGIVSEREKLIDGALSLGEVGL